MRIAIAFVCLVIVAAPGDAQTCAPVPFFALAAGAPGQQMVPSSEEPRVNLVPAGEVWLVKAGGIGYTVDPGPNKYRIQLDHSFGEGGWWYVPLEVSDGERSGTPVLSLTKPVILEANERLSARAVGLSSSARIFIMYTGWRFPAACLERLLLAPAAASSGIANGRPPAPVLRIVSPAPAPQE